jgi:hypothetical protein
MKLHPQRDRFARKVERKEFLPSLARVLLGALHAGHQFVNCGSRKHLSPPASQNSLSDFSGSPALPGFAQEDKTFVLSAARIFALRDRGLRPISSASAPAGFFVRTS